MKTLRQLIYLFVFALLLAACKGDDGDPGPQGDTGPQGTQGIKGDQGEPAQSNYIKMGFLTGTIQGQRTDGTEINESFNLEYKWASGIDGFYGEEGNKTLSLFRQNTATGGNYINFNNLLLSQDGSSLSTNPQGNTYIYYGFTKELNNTDLLSISGNTNFNDTKGYLLELNQTAGLPYNFSHSGNGIYYGSSNFYLNNELVDVYALNAYPNGSNGYNVYYRKDNGKLLQLYSYKNGEYLTEGSAFDLFNTLLFKYSEDVDAPVFYDASTGKSLYQVIPDVPADILTTANYSHNPTTGVMTFDFVLKVDKNRSIAGGTNTTKHDLIISGKFNSGGKVYKNIVGRVGG